MPQDKTAKRRLTDISFDHEGSHCALVSKLQGGPANEVTTLITKATNDISEDDFEKAVQKGAENSQATNDNSQEETPMTKANEETQTQEQVLADLEKAREQIADLEKAKEELDTAKQEKADLQKSFKEVNDTVKVLKAAEEKRKEAEYLEKAQEHVTVVNDELPAEDLAKALRSVEEVEGAEVLLKALDAYKDLNANSDLFKEVGSSGTPEQPSGDNLDVAINKAKEEHNVDYAKALDIVMNEKPELFNEVYNAE